MRGRTILSYALIALTTTTFAAPLQIRTDELVERALAAQLESREA